MRSDYYRHNFAEYNDPSCQCGHRNQTKIHYLLDCPLTYRARQQFLVSLQGVPDFDFTDNFATRSRAEKIQFILFGSDEVDRATGVTLFEISTRYIDAVIEL